MRVLTEQFGRHLIAALARFPVHLFNLWNFTEQLIYCLAVSLKGALFVWLVSSLKAAEKVNSLCEEHYPFRRRV